MISSQPDRRRTKNLGSYARGKWPRNGRRRFSSTFLVLSWAGSESGEQNPAQLTTTNTLTNTGTCETVGMGKADCRIEWTIIPTVVDFLVEGRSRFHIEQLRSATRHRAVFDSGILFKLHQDLRTITIGIRPFKFMQLLRSIRIDATPSSATIMFLPAQ
jgi:hypothetical protein